MEASASIYDGYTVRCTCGDVGDFPAFCPVHSYQAWPPYQWYPPTTTFTITTAETAPEPEPVLDGWHYVVHNVIAHPLLVIWPRLGEWLHDWTLR